MAAVPKVEPNPFDVTLTDQQHDELANTLADEIQRALDARATITNPGGDLDYWHWLFAQGKRNTKELPFPGAADLSTWIIAEKVDAMRARFTKTVFVEPVWTVEGYGMASDRAPLVEEFHQWKVEDERLQGWLQKTLQLALIEGTGVLECSEKVDRIKRTRVMNAQPKLADDGSIHMVDGQPELQRDEHGQLVPVDNPDAQGSVQVQVESWEPVRRGPSYRNVSLRDFLLLPAHAQDDSELWAYAKRFWRRLPELQARAAQGVYDKDRVAKLAKVTDRTNDSLPQQLQDSGVQVAPQSKENLIEKELWELHLLWDLDGDGVEEWYLVTLSVIHRQILRVQLDDIGLPRYFLFRPIPNPLSVYGDSHVEKLSSIGEEHMGIRNAIADRSNLVNNAPIKRAKSSPWDEEEQPWGPGAIIDVNDPNDVTAMQIPDVPNSMVGREQAAVQAAERLSGLNDVTLGSSPQESRTLGEVQMVTEQSFVRIEENIRNIQETMEDLFRVRHELWKRAAAEQPLEPSERFIRQLQLRQISLAEGGITPDVLDGTFHGKPHGSVETADKNRQRQNFNGFMAVLGGFAKMNPTLQGLFASPDVIVPLFEQGIRLYDSPNRAQLMRAMRQWQAQQQQAAMMASMMPPQPPMMPAPGPQGPGAPPPQGPGRAAPPSPRRGAPPAPHSAPPPGPPPGAPPMMPGMPMLPPQLLQALQQGPQAGQPPGVM